MAEKEGKKLTGRELFMTDKTLDQSDLKFLDDGKKYMIMILKNFKIFNFHLIYSISLGDSVKVDESLFQNLDDLDLDDDEDDDDPDYNPDASDDSA